MAVGILFSCLVREEWEVTHSAVKLQDWEHRDKTLSQVMHMGLKVPIYTTVITPKRVNDALRNNWADITNTMGNYSKVVSDFEILKDQIMAKMNLFEILDPTFQGYFKTYEEESSITFEAVIVISMSNNPESSLFLRYCSVFEVLGI